MSRPSVDVVHQRVACAAEFIDFVRTIGIDFRETRRLPLLHIETHGAPEGIGCSADDHVLWPQLMHELIPLNQLT